MRGTWKLSELAALDRVTLLKYASQVRGQLVTRRPVGLRSGQRLSTYNRTAAQGPGGGRNTSALEDIIVAKAEGKPLPAPAKDEGKERVRSWT
ncbi:hypothetical protein GCM10010221_47530 [Streptomyces parvus]|nr:hypothetical protein GCM10010221_47530 [Streptomyces parvus]